MAITMVMGNMGIKNNGLGLRKTLSPVCLLLLVGSTVHPVYGFEWQTRLNLTMSEMFDDNLNLSSINKKSGFVTEVAPGVVINGQSPMSNFNLNYRLQGLYNGQGSDAVDVLHQLQMSSLYQPISNTFFIQTSSSISQQNRSNSLVATDNISGNGSRTETKTLSIIPYLTPHFGQYATGLLKGGYTGTYFDSSNSSPNSVQFNNSFNNPITNSETILKQAGLTSGTYFNVTNWGLNYSSQEQNNAGGGNTRFENYAANARYFLNRQFNLFAQTGYENNSYATQANTTGLNNNIKNGFTYTVGGQWRPSLWYSLEIGAGNNSHVTMQYNPSSNLTSTITYNYKNVGLNLGPSWDARLNYTTPMSNWGLNYHQDTATIQQILTSQGVFTTDAFGNPVPVTNLTGQFQSPLYLVNLPNLVNDVLIRKRADFNFSYNTGKSSYNANLYNERRSYQLNPELDTVYGVSGSWQWQFIPRLSFYLRPLWQSTQSSKTSGSGLNPSGDNTLFQVSMGLTRGIPINLGRPMLLNTTLDLRHIEQMSGVATSEYIENRATANFFVQF